MDIDITALPVPDCDLRCPRCDYPLRGLPTHRCPECGRKFNIERLLRPWTRLRAPRFTGDELPFPDFGLSCSACGTPLCGAPTRDCLQCRAPFDPQATRPPRSWFLLDVRLGGGFALAALEPLLAAERIPYIPVDLHSVTNVPVGIPITSRPVLVPSEFYFELLWLLRQRRRGPADGGSSTTRAPAWRCPACGQRVPGNFELCWSCQAARPAPQ
jgi:hypothetical protein